MSNIFVNMSFHNNFGNHGAGYYALQILGINGYSPEQYNTLYFDSIIHGNVRIVDTESVRPKRKDRVNRNPVAYFDGKDSYLEIPSMPLHLTTFSISV